MKQMKEDMEKDLADVVAQEEAAVAEFDELIGSKKKEIAAAGKAIEEKLARLGDVSVKLAELKNDLENTGEELEQNEKVLATLLAECATRQKDYEMRVKTRSLEMVALAY